MTISLRPYQIDAVNRARELISSGKRRVLIVAPTGCHAAGQKILMFDGSIQAVETIQVGDQVMGPDGQPREVLQLCRGVGPMFDVWPFDGGKIFTANDEHIMTVVARGSNELLDIRLCDIADTRQYELVRMKRGRIASRVQFSTVYAGIQRFFGFTLEGDGRYLLEDYTVTHNSGKTVVAAHIIQSAFQRNSRVLFIAHRRELINQSFNKLLDAGIESKNIGVVMGNDPRRNPGACIQVASIDTLRNRAKPRADLVFFDECHRSLARSYLDVVTHYPNAVHLGLTATPYRADGKGLGDVYEELVVVSSPKELIAEGFLVEPTVLSVNENQLPDLSKVKTRAGDYNAEQLGEAVNQKHLVGSIVEHWLEYARDIPTVCFAVNVEHSKSIVQKFVDAGIAAEHLDGTTPPEDRAAILKRLNDGETRIVSNCNVLCEGWDQPSVKCAILARPTKSTGMYLQQAGRILRPFQGVPAIILDHSGNARVHGLPQQDREFSLESKTKRTQCSSPPTRTCPSCYAILEGGTKVCMCGFEFPPPPITEMTEVDGRLVVVKDDIDERRAFYTRCVSECERRGNKTGRAAYLYKEKYGVWPPNIFKQKSGPRLDASSDTMYREWVRLRELAQSKNYRPGYVEIRFREAFGRNVPIGEFMAREPDWMAAQ